MQSNLRFGAIALLAALLSACPAPRKPSPPTETPAPTAPATTEEPARIPSGALEHRIVADESQVRILVYRGGKLSAAGHNHVVVSRNLSGKLWVHEDLARSGFQIVMPVALLEVDDPQMRSEEGADFPPQVPESARQGTRKNMLGAQVLDADRYPGVTLTSLAVSGTREQMQVRTRVRIRDQTREITIPVSAQYSPGRVEAQGELALKQSDLGLAPFSVMLGALTVQDELKVKFRLVATRSEER
jgi:polyisoprenoid-binding protein YceI